MARAVPRIPAPTIKASDSWWRIRRRVVGDSSGGLVIMGEGRVEIEVGGLREDGGGVSCM